MKVMQILKLKGSTQVETVPPDARVGEAATTLSARKIGALVVLEGGAVVGIVSERDIVRRIGEEGPRALERHVADIMTAKVMHCTPEEDAITVLERMTEGRFRHMPVMLRGQLAGLLSIGDVVKARIGELHAENEAMQHMLSG